MQKGNSNTNAILTVLLLVVLAYMSWYYFTYGTLNIGQMLGL